MTLTKAQFLTKAKLRTATVDVEGWGPVMLRGIGEVKRSRRLSEMIDAQGNISPGNREKRRVRMIIDHVCEAATGGPMFTEDDFDEIGELDGAILDPIIEAIQVFDGESVGNGSAASSDTADT